MVASKQVWPLGVIYAYAQRILDRSNYGQEKKHLLIDDLQLYLFDMETVTRSKCIPKGIPKM